MTDKEKLIALMEQFSGGSQQRFAELIGVPRSNIATWMHRDRITANGREAILDTFPSVSSEWLMEGNERRSERVRTAGGGAEMLLSSPGTIHFARTELIPLFDECRASCGIVEQFEHPELVADHDSFATDCTCGTYSGFSLMTSTASDARPSSQMRLNMQCPSVVTIR